MLRIKLARFGKRNQPHYRIVINEARSKRDGKYVESIGHYAPTQTPKLLKIDMEAYNKWIAKGAQPTDTVAGLAKRFESGTPFPEKKPQLSKKARAKAAEAAKSAEEEKAAAKAAKAAKVAEKAEVATEVAEAKSDEAAPADEKTEAAQ